MIRFALTALLACTAAAPVAAQDPAASTEELPAFRKMGEELMKTGKHARALSYWVKVTGHTNATADDYLARAQCHAKLLEFETAAYHCHNALSLRPGWKTAKDLRDKMRATAQQLRLDRQLGENLFREGKFIAAITHWDRVLKILEDDAVAWFYKAACHAQLRQLPAAIAGCDRALAARPGWVQAISLRAQMKLFAGDYPGAAKDFTAAIAAERQAGRAPHPTFVQLKEQSTALAAAAKKIQTGKAAPLPRLRDERGKSIAFADLFPEQNGPKAVVFIFHGGHASPVALGQLSRLREHIQRIESTGARVYCVSRDTPLENKILASEKGLKFPLLSDSDGATTQAYGMADLRRPGKAPSTLLGVAIVDPARVLRHRRVVVDPRGELDFEALAVLAGKITGTAPPAKKKDDAGDGKKSG